MSDAGATAFLVLAIVVGTQALVFAVFRRWIPTRERLAILCRISSGHRKGELVAVAIERPHTVLRLVDGNHHRVTDAKIQDQVGDVDATILELVPGSQKVERS